MALDIGFEDIADPSGMFHEGPDMPPPPDYIGLAEKTAAGDLEAARSATQANRYAQYTPYGSQTWTKSDPDIFDQEGYDKDYAQYEEDLAAWELDPYETTGSAWDRVNDGGLGGTGSRAVKPVEPNKDDYTTFGDPDKWRSDVNLSPEVQALFDKGMMMKDISADIGLQAGGQIKDIFSTPFELDDFEGYREDVYDAMLERLETDIDKDWQSRNAELYAGGIGRGTEAYGWEQQMRDRTLNDARLQAYIGATDQAMKERGQDVSEALLQRNQPLNEYNAWRTGAQVDMPTFDAGGKQRTTTGPDYLSAGDMKGMYDLAGYNAEVGMFNQDKQNRMDIATSIMDMFSV